MAPRRPPPRDPSLAVAYTRVSTGEQVASGLGLDAQTTAIRAAVAERSWTLVGEYVDAGVSAKSMLRRPALAEAIAVVRKGPASVLVVAKLDRLARSVLDFATLVKQSRDEGWTLVVLDPRIDLSTADGRLMANMLAAFAEWERELISQRTIAGLAEARSRGTVLGRVSTIPDSTRELIAGLRAGGMTLTAIADQLTADDVPTGGSGVRWYPSTVSGVLAGSARAVA